ncbi:MULTISPECIES: hypothetical protein [unclassified Bacillus (in: firmicutes)]|uniref:hypothetical protein n=1 Tax=unclassified Bacillus (in: firmicutes) TaxID=185979 RepID=UPI0008EFE271|nr:MULTISPECIES: hypothetical protein [unclassified Bacillus (in: firmicutes)]SFA99882.1 hypothetical protein SAMN02799634_103479 [Bacillus sp. UNCCL13]SFQ81842.1 hypothetical protein SAMN04488577_2110 [Bacillus sp. cl95]
MEFYVIKQTYEDYAKTIPIDNTTEKEICYECEGIMVKIIRPIKFYLKGSKQADYYNNIVPYKIVSDRFQRLLKEHNFLGCEILDAKINLESCPSKINSEYLEGLKELYIFGRAGLVQDSEGKILEHCPVCHRIPPSIKDEALGLSINLQTWDGSDLFYFSNWEGGLIVTEKVKDVIEEEKILNVNITNIKDFVFNSLLKKLKKNDK